jgi:hypothetical protein
MQPLAKGRVCDMYSLVPGPLSSALSLPLSLFRSLSSSPSLSAIVDLQIRLDRHS